MDLHWWSIEVFDGATSSAARWQDAHGNALIEAAVTHGAYDWQWHRSSWGVVFEIAFRSDDRWPSFRDLPAVRAALDAVPDPINGLLIHPGRGGSAGHSQPRRPRPIAGAGAAELPVEPEPVIQAVAAGPPPPRAGALAAPRNGTGGCPGGGPQGERERVTRGAAAGLPPTGPVPLTAA